MPTAEAYDPVGDYERTLYELQTLFRDQAEHVAELEPGRRFLAAPIACMVQHGAYERDTRLTVAVEERIENGHAYYNVFLDHIDDTAEGVYESEEDIYTTNVVDREYKEPNGPDDEVYTHEDWRTRIGAGIGWSAMESWYWVTDTDSSPKVRAAREADKRTQELLKQWRRK